MEDTTAGCTELAGLAVLDGVTLLVLVSCELTKELVDETKGLEDAEEAIGVADDEGEGEVGPAEEVAEAALDAADAADDELLEA